MAYMHFNNVNEIKYVHNKYCKTQTPFSAVIQKQPDFLFFRLKKNKI